MVRGHNTMGQGNQNTMGKWVDMPWAGGRHTMGRGQKTMDMWSTYHG
jgi:hypothetical protein